MGKKYQRQQGESMPAFQQRVGAAQALERQHRDAVVYRRKRFKQQESVFNRIADRVDGYDRDDLGESPDF